MAKRHGRMSPGWMVDMAKLLGWKRDTPRKLKRTGRCRVCDRKVKHPQLYYCHREECREKVPGDITPRKLCFMRDKGVCCVCGLDTRALIKYMALCGDQPAWRRKGSAPKHYREIDWRYRYQDARRAYLEEFNLSHRVTAVWDMDHVIPVEYWNEDIDELNRLDNLQTLCIPCHRTKTAEQAAMRAKTRRIRKKRKRGKRLFNEE